MALLKTLALEHGDTFDAPTGGMEIVSLYTGGGEREQHYGGSNYGDNTITATATSRREIKVIPGAKIPGGYTLEAAANDEHIVRVEYYEFT